MKSSAVQLLSASVLDLCVYSPSDMADSTCFGPRKKSGQENNFLGLVQIESKAHRWFWVVPGPEIFSLAPILSEGHHVDS